MSLVRCLGCNLGRELVLWDGVQIERDKRPTSLRDLKSSISEHTSLSLSLSLSMYLNIYAYIYVIISICIYIYIYIYIGEDSTPSIM